MTTYRVTWEVSVEADNPQQAAAKAFEIQKESDSGNAVFDVFEGCNHCGAFDGYAEEDEHPKPVQTDKAKYAHCTAEWFKNRQESRQDDDNLIPAWETMEEK